MIMHILEKKILPVARHIPPIKCRSNNHNSWY